MFEYFPQRWFTDASGDQILMTNICRRVSVPKEFKTNATLYMTYSIRDGETARDIAERLYNDSGLFWVIYLVNGIHDIMNQWPIQAQQLNDQLLAQYGWEGMAAVHHYEDPNGLITDLHALRVRVGDLSLTDAEVISRFSLKAVTIEDYEQLANDNKRNIKLVDPDHASRFKSQIEELLNE
ncbi:baseplate wedge subunit [Vibrio phage K469]